MSRRPASSRTTVAISAPPAQVFAVLVDARSYPDWLVGAQRITAVDDDWPGVESRFRHRIGIGPLALPGSTSIRAIDPPTELVLAAMLLRLPVSVALWGRNAVSLHALERLLTAADRPSPPAPNDETPREP